MQSASRACGIPDTHRPAPSADMGRRGGARGQGGAGRFGWEELRDGKGAGAGGRTLRGAGIVSAIVVADILERGRGFRRIHFRAHRSPHRVHVGRASDLGGAPCTSGRTHRESRSSEGGEQCVAGGGGAEGRMLGWSHGVRDGGMEMDCGDHSRSRPRSRHIGAVVGAVGRWEGPCRGTHGVYGWVLAN